MPREFLTPDGNGAAPDGGPYRDIPDEVILESSQERPGMFAVLVDRYQAAFLRAAMRVVRERTEAEDVVQDAFVKMYRYARRFKSGQDRKFSSWAYKIVINTAITHYHKQRKQALPMPEEGDPTAGEAQVQFRGSLRDRETEAVVRQVLGELPADLALVLRAYYLEDKSYRTISEEQGMTIGALKMKLFRARKLFERELGSSK